MITVTHYCYTLSTWSLAAEDAVAEIKDRYGDKLDYQWRLAVMHYNGGRGAFADGELEAPYARLEAVTGQRVSLGWWREGYDWTIPDRVVDAARALGATATDVRLALATAGLRQGENITDPDFACSLASRIARIDADALRAEAMGPATMLRLHQSASEFAALGVPFVPAFKLSNAIDDTVVLSGVWRPEPLVACIEGLLKDEEEYRRLGYLN
jgi:predicted DsbA family dithiol-disulfide isomerase